MSANFVYSGSDEEVDGDDRFDIFDINGRGMGGSKRSAGGEGVCGSRERANDPG